MENIQTKSTTEPKSSAKLSQITPCLWFDDQAEEAAKFYTSVFDHSNIKNTTHYLETGQEIHGKEAGSVMTVEFEIEGYLFTALNGGPHFKFTPAVSFFVNCDTKEEVNKIWDKLSDGGNILMPIDKYPFSDRYGWLEDKYGLSWQVILSKEGFSQKIIPSMLFVGDKAGKAEEAMNFYTSIFDGSEIKAIHRYGPDQKPDEEGTVMYGDFTLEDHWFAAMDSAQDHSFNFNEAVSFMVSCEDQDEVDYYWEQLSAVPDSEQCGWLKDKYGVSWQITPTALSRLLKESEPEKVKRVFEAMLQMKKLDIEKLEQA